MAWPPPFEPFASGYLSALATIAAASVLVPGLARRYLDARGQRVGALVVAAALLLHEIAKVPIRVRGYGDPLAESLPALLTPELPYDYPHPWFFVFFGGHGLIFVGVLYATVVVGLHPALASLGRTLVASLGLIAAMVPVNAALEANYLYLRAKPEGATLVDLMGPWPWPWYVPVMAASGLLVCLLCYAPVALARRLRRAAEPTRAGPPEAPRPGCRPPGLVATAPGCRPLATARAGEPHPAARSSRP